jgi:hypothetical protein
MAGRVPHRTARSCPAHGTASGAVDNPIFAKPHLTNSNSCPTKRSHLYLHPLPTPSESAAAGRLVWLEGASQSPGARLSGPPGWTNPDLVPAAVRAGSQPGGIPVGQAQTTCSGQLLSQRFERAACDRAQQAQECSKAPFDYHQPAGRGLICGHVMNYESLNKTVLMRAACASQYLARKTISS